MYTVLVTGVGAIIGYGIISSLRQGNNPVKIIGMDIYSDAVGQYWCDIFEQAIPAASPDYPQFLKGIIEKYSIDLVMFGTEQEAARISAEAELLCDIKAKFVLNDQELIQVAGDKWLTHLKLVEFELPVIKTYIDGDFYTLSQILGSPMLLKPRKSYASKGICRIYIEEDFIYWKNKLAENFMVQEIVGEDDAEYTVGVFGYGDGTCSNTITFQRKLSGEGATVKAKVCQIPELDSYINLLVEIFRPVGPTNFQFRLHNGNYLLLEINPRISASTSLRTSFGYNEADMCIEYYLKGQKPKPGEIRQGRAIRYIKDLVIYDSCNL